MAIPKTTELAVLVTLHDEHGQARLRAEIMRKNPNPDEVAEYPFLSTSWSFAGFDLGAEYDGFAATAYVGDGGNTWGTRQEDRGVWGMGVSYSPHHIETARHAQAIAKVLAKVERGLAKAQESDGYLKEGDYAVYVLRIARILRIKDIYVRNHARARNNSGERYRKVTGGSLQYFVSDVAESVKAGTHRADYIAHR